MLYLYFYIFSCYVSCMYIFMHFHFINYHSCFSFKNSFQHFFYGRTSGDELPQPLCLRKSLSLFICESWTKRRKVSPGTKLSATSVRGHRSSQTAFFSLFSMSKRVLILFLLHWNAKLSPLET